MIFRIEVGQTLQIDSSDGGAIEDVKFQWYRVLQAEDWVAISGATRAQVSSPTTHPDPSASFHFRKP